MIVKCPKCGLDWDKNRRGKKNWCLPCRRLYERDWRARRKAAGRPVITKPSKQVEKKKLYYQLPAVKARRAAAMRKRYYDPAHAQRIRARMDMRNAVRRGEVTKPIHCEDCGVENKLSSHHDDYSKPFQVRWLCRPCHQKADALAEPTAQEADRGK